MMHNRGANASEISEVYDLQSQLKLNYGIDPSVKEHLIAYVQKEISLGSAVSNQVKSLINNPVEKTRITETISKITQDIKEICTKVAPVLTSQLSDHGMELKPDFAQQIDYKNIQQKLMGNQLNQNDMAKLLSNIEKRVNSQIQE